MKSSRRRGTERQFGETKGSGDCSHGPGSAFHTTEPDTWGWVRQ